MVTARVPALGVSAHTLLTSGIRTDIIGAVHNLNRTLGRMQSIIDGGRTHAELPVNLDYDTMYHNITGAGFFVLNWTNVPRIPVIEAAAKYLYPRSTKSYQQWHNANIRYTRTQVIGINLHQAILWFVTYVVGMDFEALGRQIDV